MEDDFLFNICLNEENISVVSAIAVIPLIVATAILAVTAILYLAALLIIFHLVPPAIITILD